MRESSAARGVGTIRPGERVGYHDHVCWAYLSEQDRSALATWWIADGLRSGQAALYVADASVDQLTDELAGVPLAQSAIATGALRVVPSQQLYDLSAPIDAKAQLALYAGVVDEALANGFRGVRVAADITPLVADPTRRESHLRWEQYADRYIAENPLTPMCLYDASAIHGLDAIASGHPAHGPDAQPFALYAVASRRASLEGEVDACVAEVLTHVLRTMPATDELDVSGLRFADGRTVAVIEREVHRRRAAGDRLVLTGVSPMLHHMWAVLGFDRTVLQRG